MYNDGVTIVAPFFVIRAASARLSSGEAILLSQEISDDVILMRPFRIDDAQETYTAVRESLIDLKPWMSWAHDGYSLSDSKEFIRITRARWQEGTLFAFVITDKRSRAVLGGCSLSHIHPVYHLCNLGYWVRSSRHGEGIAGRATIGSRPSSKS